MNFFDDYEKANKLIKIIEKWQGVKYYHRGYTMGGVDCTGYILNLFLEIGLIDKIIKTSHSKDWYFHTTEEELLKEIEKYKIKYFFVDKKENPQFGDLILFSNISAKTIHHLGLYICGNKFTHCLTDLGVTISQLKPFWDKYIIKYARVKG